MNDKTIVRGKHDPDNPYFMLDRRAPQNKNLSYEAVGMLAYLLSKPEDWEVQIEDLQREGCGRDKVYRIIRELVTAGYVVHRRLPSGGKGKPPLWGGYTVYEKPVGDDLPYTPFQDTVNTVYGKPATTYIEDSLSEEGPEPTDKRKEQTKENDKDLRADEKIGAAAPGQQQSLYDSVALSENQPVENADNPTFNIHGISGDSNAVTAVASQPATPPPNPIPVHPLPPPRAHAPSETPIVYTTEGAQAALTGREASYRAVCELGYAFTPKMNNRLIWSMVNFYQGKVSGNRVGTDWDTFKIDFVEGGVTPAMIAGFAIWWDYTYNRGRVGTDRISYPAKPEKIYEHFERYAADKYFERCIERGESRLSDLMDIHIVMEPEGELVDKATADALIVQMVGQELANKIRE